MLTRWPLVGLLLFGAVLASSCPAAAQGDEGPTLEDLRPGLRSQYPDQRRRAVSKLAGVGGERALELILAALSDREPEVADEAQLVVVRLEAAGARSKLLGRAGLGSRDRLVRLRAAEALGRLVGPVDGVALARALDRREPEVARTLLWTLERLARRRALTADPAALFARIKPFLGRHAEDGVRAAALQALVHIDPARAAQAVASLRGVKGSQTACSVLIATAALRTDDCLEEITAQLNSPDAMVRLTAVQLLGRVECNRTTLSALVARLDSETDVRSGAPSGPEPRPVIRERIVATLQRLTGMRHGEKSAAWRHTVERLPADWTSRAASPEATGPGREGGSVAALQRVRPRSDRIAVLVDFSGSLWNEREDGTCRKDLLDPEVAALLGRIDPEGIFFLVPFASEPHPFTSEPVRATRRNIKNAQRYFARASMRGKGNLFDAVTLAIDQPQIDRILILTDGAPTGGHRWNVDLMIDLLRERTRFRPVTFDFVLIDAPGRLVRRWQSLASGSGGRLVTVET